ncbi:MULTISPECIES: OsmC family protein [Roseivirga]|uniref:Redox protein n=1 Tax=Roseivirga thermotolerans TaxID=1758176 RepID=A0ABQ3HZQ6_9BACT|nr:MULTISPECIES: OsmC family protein [Roseivirga]MEC7756173.1 OsmC family protein [Bacteroidota bacterium]GHE50338.1 redox protein [Roseivirga thermotolerans]|tara:strand:+ start:1698 stop:2102 length:405 start_codon:yes stop_codon:yes gene_type:complete
MKTVETKYEGGLRTSSVHLQSKNTFHTDAPLDNNGKGETFSPTDTVAAALGACMMTVMAIAGEKKGWDMSGMHLATQKIMAANPRRIAALRVDFYWDNCAVSDEDRSWIKEIGLNCPVALSLHPDLKQEITFHF